MTLSISFQKKPKATADTAILPVYKDNRLGKAASEWDKKTGGLIAYALKNQENFKGKRNQALTVTAPKGSTYARFVLIGMEDDKPQDIAAWTMAGGRLIPVLKAAGAVSAMLFLENAAPEEAAQIALGLSLRDYSFDKYKSKSKDKSGKPSPFAKLEIVTDGATQAAKLFESTRFAAEGVHLARNLVNEPPNELYPESFAKIVQQELKPLGVEVGILDEKKMQKLGFGAHLAVGMGSARPPRVVVMRWNGAKRKSKPVALVGKGVTFDTGGISIKPAAGLDEMKMDMGGAAAVVGAIKTLARRKAKAHVIGVIGLAENMPSDRAYRPGDIVKSLSGKTIEVLNTDAEGRLVLCDALTYVQDTYDPALIIDLATLTGAIMVALGHEYCGTFANKDEVWSQLESASRATGEKLWRMPLDEAFRKEMESGIADLKNLGSLGRYGGACSAAGFLEHFVDKGRAWVHMDIAGTAWVNADKPLGPKHATGFGVRVLDRLIADYYED